LLILMTMPKRKTYTKKTDIDKPWYKKKGRSRYKNETVTMRKTFLIVCEGQTEECYFKAFPIRTAVVRAVNLGGQSKMKLVECAKELARQEESDEVWCVFDMDVNRGEIEFRDFDNAIESARSLNFHVAYSNDAFELWFYLHYQYTDVAQLRSFYYEQLGSLWGINYEKFGKEYRFSSGIFNKLQNDERASMEKAISCAKRLFEMQKDRTYHEQNPLTMVYQLVRSLQKECKEKSF